MSPPRRARRAADVPTRATGRILAVLAYLALIFTLSSWQHPPAGPAVKHLDKVVHAIEYAGLGVLVYRAVELWSPGGWAGAVAFLLGSFVAAADEIYQARIPGRQSTAADAAADLVGIALGIGLLRWRRRRRGRNKREQGREQGRDD